MDPAVQIAYPCRMVTTKGAATRSRIVEATVDLLVDRGPERTWLDDVMAASGTSKSQLFHYFPGGKDELIHAATARQTERVLGNSDAHPGALDSWAAWRAWVDTMVRLHREQSEDDACEVAALAGRAVDPDLESRRIVGAAFTEWVGRIEGGIALMRASRLIRDDADPRQLAISTVASLNGGALYDRATGTRDGLEIALEAALANLRSFAVAEPTGR